MVYLFLWFFLALLGYLSFFKFNDKILLIGFHLFLVIFVGLRYEVGADWGSYEFIYEIINNHNDYYDAIIVSEIGYSALNLIAYDLGFGIVFVNFICSLFLAFGIYKVSFLSRYKWLSLTILFGYTLVAVGMGYTRQSVAIGCLFVAVYYLFKEKNNKLVLFFCILGLLFHKSMVLVLALLPLIMIKYSSKTKLILSFILVLSMVMFFFQMNSLDPLDGGAYTDGTLSSSGVLFRLAIHIPPLIIYGLSRKRMKKHFDNSEILFLDAFVLLILLAFSISFSFSTIADRFNLYFVVFDLIIFHWLIEEISQVKYKVLLYTGIVIENSIIFVVWLLFSPYSKYYFEYKNILFL